jgi:tyrosine-protein phosphatase YwqE
MALQNPCAHRETPYKVLASIPANSVPRDNMHQILVQRRSRCIVPIVTHVDPCDHVENNSNLNEKLLFMEK